MQERKKAMNNTALVTGASGGLGLEFAKLLAKDGNDLLLVARNGHRLEEIKNELEQAHGVKVYFLACDLTQDDGANKVYDYAKENNLQIDVLINNAGFGDFGNYLDSVWEKQRDMVNLNVLALMRLTYLFVPAMKERGNGKILNVASIASFQPGPLMSVYYASKAFVLSFSEALAVELKKTGVTVTALCPGPIRTGFEKTANLAYSGLFKNLKVASAEKVARFGYKKMKKGKVVTIQGGSNRFLVFSTRFAPRSLVRKVVYKIMKLR